MKRNTTHTKTALKNSKCVYMIFSFAVIMVGPLTRALMISYFYNLTPPDIKRSDTAAVQCSI